MMSNNITIPAGRNTNVGPVQAFIYVRTATHEGDDTKSRRQYNQCRQIADRLGVRRCELFQDIGWSARTLKRPAMQAMMGAIITERPVYVIVRDWSCLSRNVADSVRLSQLFSDNGVTVVTSSAAGNQLDLAAVLETVGLFWGVIPGLSGEKVNNEGREEASRR